MDLRNMHEERVMKSTFGFHLKRATYWRNRFDCWGVVMTREYWSVLPGHHYSPAVETKAPKGGTGTSILSEG